jgi:hypothetical protein
MRRLGSWLALAAIALQIAWPVLVNAKPRSVTLVPLCTVDGVTHYLEVNTGKTPLEESTKHTSHCSLCYLGLATVGLPSHTPSAWFEAETADVVSPAAVFSFPPFALIRSARAPPSAFTSL